MLTNVFSKPFVHAYRYVRILVTVLLTVSTTALILIVFSNVIGRYFFNISLAWAEEASRFLFIWAVFLGAVLANEKYEHMNLDIVVKFASGKLRSAVITISQIVALIVLLIIFHGGMIATFENLTWLSPALEIPYGYVYSIIPFASLLMAGQTLIRLIYNLIPAKKS